MNHAAEFAQQAAALREQGLQFLSLALDMEQALDEEEEYDSDDSDDSASSGDSSVSHSSLSSSDSEEQARDREDEEEIHTALQVLGITFLAAADDAEQTALAVPGGRGPRGPYNVEKSRDSFALLLASGDNYFKKHFRWVPVSRPS